MVEVSHNLQCHMHICSNCGHSETIFGSQGGEILATKYNLPVLAKLPLDITIRQGSDAGIPIVTSVNSITDAYNNLAINLRKELAHLPEDNSNEISEVIKELVDEK